MNPRPFTSSIKANWRRVTASTLAKGVAFSLIVAAPLGTLSAPAANAIDPTYGAAVNNLACDTNLGNTNIKITPSHGKAFYVDGTQANAANDIDSSYIGYRIGTTSGSLTNAWVKISNFGQTVTSAGSTKTDVTLSAVAGSSDKFQVASRDSNITTSDTHTAFFLIKANNINSWGNSDVAYGQFYHTVTVYDGDPDAGGNILRQCIYTFTKITNTIAAAANKVDSLTTSKTAPLLGETFTITANGQTGTIGAGEAPDSDIIWLSAAPFSSFPLKALRLEKTSYVGSKSGCLTPIINQLLIPAAASTTCDGNYTAIYTFRVIGSGPSNTLVAPVAQIASGTQIKHTTLKTITLDLSKATSSSISMAKGFESMTSSSDSVTVNGIYYARVGYIETATTTSSVASLDFIVDSPTVGAIMETNTANGGYGPRFHIGNGTPIAITPTLSAGKYYFQGPFNFTNTNPLVIHYSMLLPIPASGTINYENVVIGNIGGKEIYANGGIPLAAVVVSSTGGTTPSTGFKKSAPGITTVTPTGITDDQAVLHGTLDALSETTTLRFEWGTSPTMAESTTVLLGETTTVITDSNTAQTKTTVTGLTPGVTYYYRFVGVGASGLVTYGEILSFHVGLTAVITKEAAPVRFTTATIFGNYVNERTGTNIYYRFYWSLDSASVLARTSESRTVGVNQTVITGAGTDTSTALTGLTEGRTYYYMFTAESATVGTLFDRGDLMQFTTGFTTTVAASSITKASAVLNGTLGYRDMDFSSLNLKFIWGTSPTLTSDSTTVTASPSSLDVGGAFTYSLSGLTAGTTYYFRAFSESETVRSYGEILSFTTSVDTPAPPAPSAPPVVITWQTPSPLNYPTPLSGTQLNAVATCNGAAVAGTYVYSPVLGTILAPGTYTMVVSFVPTPPSTCGGASTTVQIVVKAPEVKITWPTPPTELGPVTLSPSQLNAVCSVPGKLVYDPALGTVLPAGTYTLKVTCIPTDPNLPPVTTTVPFVVAKEVAKITWNDPAPAYGPLTLAPRQLNARCSVAGTLTYTPALGTVLEPGTYTLSVTCTPNNPLIAPVTTTVTLIVKGAVEAPKATTSPITFTKGTVSWEPAKYAVSYSVEIRGKQMCETKATSCALDATVGPKTPVIVTAIGADKKTASARAVYFNDKLLTAIEINFATNSYFLDAKANKEINRVSAIVKREGFTIVEITGHTDPRGGALNVPLSNNRSDALKKAMLKLVPYLDITNKGLSYDDPKASNKTAAGMAANRRSVGAVK